MNALTFGAIIVAISGGLLWAVVHSEKAVRKRRERGEEYDERQKLVRGEAYRRAFIAAFCFLAVDGLVSSWHPWLENAPYQRFWLALFVGDFFFEAYAICHDAYFRVGTTLKKNLTFILRIGVVSVVLLSVMLLRRDPLLRNGMLTMTGACCVMTLLELVLVAMIVDHALLARRKEQDEEA